MPSRSRFTRRRLLGAVGTSAIPLTDGCLDIFDNDDSAPPRLSSITVQNSHDRPHRIGVLVEEDGELVHWSGHDLDAVEDHTADSKRVSSTWTSDPARFVVHARLDDETSWKTSTLVDLPNANCYAIEIEVERDGSFTIWSSAQSASCNDDREEM